MKSITKNSASLYFYSLFSVLCILVVMFRWFVLRDFSFKYADSDQAIMWNASVEFSKGFLHEPRFWGQNYNSMLEALLAAPLLFFSVPVYKALPIITSFFSLFPFFIVSIICVFKGQKAEALFVIAIPLFLPVEYDFLTSISRGFVSGLFISSFGWITVFFQNRSWAFICFGFFCVVGYSLNQNTVLLSLPLFLYFFIKNIENKLFYIKIFIGILGGGLFHIFVSLFYVIHPNYTSRFFPSLEFSFQNLTSSFQDLDKHFNFVSPFFWHSGWLVLIGFILIALGFFKNKQPALALSVCALVFLTLLSLGFDKIHDGTDSVFFSYSRMFLAIPMGLIFYIPFLNIKSNWPGSFISILSIVFFIIKLSMLANSIKTNVDHKKNHVVSVDPIEYVLKECHKINYYSKKNKTDLIIIYSHGYYDFIDFGCSACLDSFPKTLRPEFERRTWRLIEDENAVYKNIIVIDEHQEIAKNLSRLKEKSIHYLNIKGYYIISNNSLNTMAFLDLLNIPVRSFN